MKYYCVTTTFDNRGRVTANITCEREANQMPESTFTSATRKDIYSDWFDSLKAAESFVEEARNA